MAALEAADVAVLKVQPLGGVRACLELAERLGLPVVVSSALETSVGIAAGVALAAALPELPYACGLNTVALLEHDVVADPLMATDGEIDVRRVAPSGDDWHAPDELARWWRERLDDVAGDRSWSGTRPPSVEPAETAGWSEPDHRWSSLSRPRSSASATDPAGPASARDTEGKSEQ